MAKNTTNKTQLIVEMASNQEYFGGNSWDWISIFGNHNLIDGGNGNDWLSVMGSDNTVVGGNGDDVLAAASMQEYSAAENTLDGGRGNDTFDTFGASASAVSGVGALITGGLGMDQFHLRQNSDVMLNNEDSYGRESIQDGDTIQGVFDVITDYAAGELLDIGVTQLRTDPMGLTHMWPGHSHLTLNDGEYALVRGNWGGSGEFDVASDGADTLVVFDFDPPQENYFEYNGSVVLVGVSDAASINVGSIPV